MTTQTNTRLQQRVDALEAQLAHCQALLTAVPITDQSVYATASVLLRTQADTLDWSLAQLTGPQRLDKTLTQMHAMSHELRRRSHAMLYHVEANERTAT